MRRPPSLRRSNKGAALAEYVMLLIFLGIGGIITVYALGVNVKETYQTAAGRLTGGEYPSGPEQFGMVAGVPGFCPPAGSGWRYDPYNEYYLIPGVALVEPGLELWVGNRVSAFGGPGEQYSKIPLNDTRTYNYWGEYWGIDFFVWDMWDWTAKIPGSNFTLPDDSCTTIERPVENPDNDPAITYAPYYPGTGTWLEGTPGGDSLNLRNGTYEGVIGYGWDDTITDEGGASHILIPGPGNETVTSYGGRDIYLYARGDGIDQYQPANDSQRDVVALMDLTTEDVTFSFGPTAGVKMSFPDGGSLNVQFQDYSQANRIIDEWRFANVTWSSQQLRNAMVERQKASGNVKGTRLSEDHFYRTSTDGAINYEESTQYGGPDTLYFAEAMPDDLKMWAAGNDLYATTGDGDQLYMKSQFSRYTYYGFDNLVFADGSTLDRQQILNKAANDAKARGYVDLTDHSEEVIHTASVDPSYTLKSTSALSETDILRFTETNLADAKFSVGGNDRLIIKANGDTIQIEYQLYDKDNYRLERLIFADGEVSLQEQNDKAMADMMAAGTVERTRLPNTLNYVQAQHGNVTIKTDAWETDEDYLYMDFNFADASFAQSGSSLLIQTPDGAQIDIDYHFYTRNWGVDHLVFNGTEYSKADIQTRIDNGG